MLANLEISGGFLKHPFLRLHPEILFPSLARMMALCSLPRTNPGDRIQFSPGNRWCAGGSLSRKIESKCPLTTRNVRSMVSDNQNTL